VVVEVVLRIILLVIAGGSGGGGGTGARNRSTNQLVQEQLIKVMMVEVDFMLPEFKVLVVVAVLVQ
jgi:hypothetical protein